MAERNPGFETLRKICAAGLRGEQVAWAPDAAFMASGLALAERHRVVPLLAAGLPAGLQETWRRRLLALAQQTVRLEQELGLISACLSAAGVDLLVLKGPGMARQAYVDPEWRAYDDLDLWVPSRQLEGAVRTLETAGYRRKSPLGARALACARRAGIEVALVHPQRGRLVEVAQGRPALASSRRAAREILESAMTLEVGGAPVRVPTPVHTLLLACAHGAHHRWDRLVWLVDVAGLWLRLSPAERETACTTARQWQVETRFGLGLRLAADTLELPLEGRAAALADSPPVRALARRVGLEKIGPDSRRVSTLDRLRFENDARDSVRQRLRARAGWIFVPTLGDIEAVPLPARLYPLYAVIRPLRLLRHPWLRHWRLLAGRD